MTIMLNPGTKLVLATHNDGKVRELKHLFEPFGLELFGAGDFGLSAPDETGDTFAENALIKARFVAQGSGVLALADDSGLSVDALDGAPGIYSARWGGADQDFSQAMDRVNKELQAKGAVKPEARGASFWCALALVSPDDDDDEETVIEARVKGLIVWPPRGQRGFGYDPIFLPEGESRTFGEMDADEKHGLHAHRPALSHRARAFEQLKARYLDGKNNEKQ